MSVRGIYYREPSTRVVQPIVQVRKDLPRDVDVTATYLLDAITSASVGAGMLNGDTAFHELRNEVNLEVGKTWSGHTRLAPLYRYSQEPDWTSHTVGLRVHRDVWENSGTVALTTALSFDHAIGPNLDKSMRSLFAGASYTQALTPTTLAQVVYDLTFQDGFFGNPYLNTPNYGHENPPRQRLRHALAARVAQYLPRATLGFQAHYRFYWDQDPSGGADNPWGLTAHSLELRIYKSLGRDVEARLSYRAHSQTSAEFWCNADERAGGDAGCYGRSASYWSFDPKYGQLATQLPELKLMWALRSWEGLPLFGFFSPGTLEVSYGYFFQSAHYGGNNRPQTGYATFLVPHDWGGAHVLQGGYSRPF